MKLPLWIKTRNGKWIRLPYELLNHDKFGRPTVSAVDIVLHDRWWELVSQTDWSQLFTYEASLDVYFLKELDVYFQKEDE